MLINDLGPTYCYTTKACGSVHNDPQHNDFASLRDETSTISSVLGDVRLCGMDSWPINTQLRYIALVEVRPYASGKFHVNIGSS